MRKAGYDILLKHPMSMPARFALIGYCFGGMVGVEFGSTGVPLAAIIAIHGSFATIRTDGRRTSRASS